MTRTRPLGRVLPLAVPRNPSPLPSSIIDMPQPCKACGLYGSHFCPGSRDRDVTEWFKDVVRGAMTACSAGCPDHKRYQGKRKPRSTCEACWRIWIALNPR